MCTWDFGSEKGVDVISIPGDFILSMREGELIELACDTPGSIPLGGTLDPSSWLRCFKADFCTSQASNALFRSSDVVGSGVDSIEVEGKSMDGVLNFGA